MAWACGALQTFQSRASFVFVSRSFFRAASASTSGASWPPAAGLAASPSFAASDGCFDAGSASALYHLENPSWMGRANGTGGAMRN